MGVKNYNQDYQKWAMDKEKNEVIANANTTPTFTTPILSYIFSNGNEQNAPVTTPTSTAVSNKPASTVIDRDKATAENTYDKWSGEPNLTPTTTPVTTPVTEKNGIGWGKWFSQIMQDLIAKGKAAANGTPSDTGEGSVEGSEENPPSETPAITQTPTDGGFAKWLETDPAMQERMRQAESDYYRNRAGYGVQGENLAQSGLIGSGWDSHLDATAYAAMQAEKAGVRSEGYAKWLGDQEAAKAESAANADRLNTDAQTVFSHLVEQGKESITDADLSYYYGLGFSKDAIDKAVTAYNDYSAKSKNEASNTFMDSFNTLMGGGTEADFLTSLGVSTEGMDQAQIDAATDSAVEQAFKDGEITAEVRSAYYKAGQIFDEDTSGMSMTEIAENAANSVANASTYLNEGKLTEADYKEIIDTAYKKLNVSSIEVVGFVANSVTLGSGIKIDAEFGGVKRTYYVDRAGKMNITDKEYLGILNSKYGDSPLAVNDGKLYFQYAKEKWTEIGNKQGSEGSIEQGNDVMRVVCEYVMANKLHLVDGSGNSIPYGKLLRTDDGKMYIR